MLKNMRDNVGVKKYGVIFFSLMLLRVGAAEIEIDQNGRQILKNAIENYEDHEEKFIYFARQCCQISNIQIFKKRWLCRKEFQVLFHGDAPYTPYKKVFFLNLKNTVESASRAVAVYDMKLFYFGLTDLEFFSASTSYFSFPAPEKKLHVNMGIRDHDSGVVDFQNWEIRLAWELQIERQL